MTEPGNGIKAIISDFGGVLTTPLIQSFMSFQDKTGITTEVLGKAMQAATEANGDNPLFEMERGEITEVAFLETLTDSLEPLLGHRPEMHRFKEIYFEALDSNPPMIELMQELKAVDYRMALLTNNVREWEPRWRAMLPELDEIFEVVVDSAFVGMRKPEHEIYHLTVERLGGGLRAADCIFVDDIGLNCDAAREVGMTPVLFETTEQARAEIEFALA
jgi:epoxide hydrolase-like predicted phosphatase